MIIDLRNDQEILNSPYDKIIIANEQYPIEYHHIPIMLQNNYITSVRQNTEQLIKVLRLIQTSGDKGILLHCVAGTDRTGLIICIIYLLLGVPEEKIIEDFHLSVTGLNFDNVEQFLQSLRQEGGIHKILRDANYHTDEIYKLVHVLTANNS